MIKTRAKKKTAAERKKADVKPQGEFTTLPAFAPVNIWWDESNDSRPCDLVYHGLVPNGPVYTFEPHVPPPVSHRPDRSGAQNDDVIYRPPNEAPPPRPGKIQKPEVKTPDMILVETIYPSLTTGGVLHRALHRLRYAVNAVGYAIPSLISDTYKKKWDTANHDCNMRLMATYGPTQIDVYYKHLISTDNVQFRTPVICYDKSHEVHKITHHHTTIHPELAKYISVVNSPQITSNDPMSPWSGGVVDVTPVETPINMLQAPELMEQLTIPKLLTHPPSEEVFLQRLDQATASVELSAGLAEETRKMIGIFGMNTVSETSLLLGMQLRNSRERVQSLQNFLRNR